MARAPQRQVGTTLSIPERAKEKLDRQAKQRGVGSSIWAGQVFDLGFAAVCAREKGMRVTDADLDAIVGATLLLWERGEWDSASIAKGLGVSEATVSRVLEGWRSYRRAS